MQAIKKNRPASSPSTIPSEFTYEADSAGPPGKRSLGKRLFVVVATASLMILIGAALLFRIKGIEVEQGLDPTSIAPEEGFLYTSPGPTPRSGFEIASDSMEQQFSSGATLLESGSSIGLPHSEHESIRKLGEGRFSHWNGAIYFSTSDNSDPRFNGRKYVIRAHQFLSKELMFRSFLGAGILLIAVLIFAGRPLLIWLSALFFAQRSAQLACVLAAALIVISSLGIPTSIAIDPSSIGAEGGFLHTVMLDEQQRLFTHVTSDDMGTIAPSTLRFFENDRELGPAHSEHAVIKSYGRGRFSHWRGALYFSSSDNSNPKTNGRHYHAEARAALRADFLYGALALLALPLAAYLRRVRALREVLVPLAVVGVALALFDYTSGVAVWLDAGIFAIAATVLALKIIAKVFAPRQSTTGVLGQLQVGLPLLVGSFFFVCAFLEFVLWAIAPKQLERAASENTTPQAKAPVVTEAQLQHIDGTLPQYEDVPDNLLGTTLHIRKDAMALARSRKGILVMPPAWERSDVLVPGANHAFRWHNVLHIHDDNDMRRIAPFPPKDPKRFRIAVFGDSFTYGYGVDEHDIYTTLLQNDLDRNFQVEVLNLGRSGYQSEDIARLMLEFVPKLNPDLVIYGMCLNDFLPSRVAERSPFPLPVYPYLNTQTRLYGAVNHGLSSLLLRLGMRLDFYGQINEDIDAYSKRLERDLREMNSFLASQGRPPIITMVFDIKPEIGSLGSKLTTLAEQLMQRAGLDVVSAEALNRRFNDEPIRVSAWEGHPNEIAHAAYAALFRDRIISRGYLDNYRKVISESESKRHTLIQ